MCQLTKQIICECLLIVNTFYELKNKKSIFPQEWNVRKTSLTTVLKMKLRVEMVNSFATHIPTLINWQWLPRVLVEKDFEVLSKLSRKEHHDW